LLKSRRLGLGLVVLIASLGGFAVHETRAAPPAVTKYGERNANAPPELDAFAFFIGNWEGIGKTKLADGKSAEFSAAWIGRYIFDGMAIADEFHSSAPNGSPYLGISLRQYNREKRSWVIEYLNVTNSFLRRQVNATSGSVKVAGNTVVVISESAQMWSRESYRVESHDHFTYDIDLSSDGGRSWAPGQIEMSFTRKE
jgi:hypothetical protein